MLFKPVIPVLEYMVFYDYFKNELCENKEKVELKCNGKCQLKKELAKASDFPENGKEKRITFETNVVLYQEIEEHFVFDPQFYTYKSKIPTNYNLSYSYVKTNYVFRPPIV